MALEAGAQGDQITITRNELVDIFDVAGLVDGGGVGGYLDVGGLYYLSATNPGSYTQTPDTTTAGGSGLPVGTAVGPNKFAVEIQSPIVVWMASRKLTVLHPSGYQEVIQTGDTLLVDGEINLQVNKLTGVPIPTVDADAANKAYVDDKDTLLQGTIASHQIELDSKVQKDGDNMTGNLTLGTDKITLGATDGDIVCGSDPFGLTADGTQIVANGGIRISTDNAANDVIYAGPTGEQT